MSNRTDIREALGGLADFILPHLQGAVLRNVRGLSALSTAQDAVLDVPGLALPLLPFQRAGVSYALKARRAIIGDEMGLGKTPQFIASVVADGKVPALLICPPSLTLNWRKEFKRFAPQLRTKVLSGQTPSAISAADADVFIIGDSVISHWEAALIEVGFRAFGIDESHRMKNYKAKRTKAAKNISRKLDTDGLRLLLSGTAAKSNHLELLAQLDILGVVDGAFGDQNGFLDRYAPKKDRYTREDANGFELNEIMKDSFFVRRLWNDVKHQLGVPAEQSVKRLPRAIEMTGKAADEYKAADRDLRSFLKTLKSEAEVTKSMRAEKLVKLGVLRQKAGWAKVAGTIEQVEEILEEDETNQVLIFAWQREIVKAYAKHFNCGTIMGGDSVEKTEATKADFQAGNSRVLVLNHQAGGVGHTLTAANYVVFGEFEWTPGDMTQCEKRADRIGQTRVVTSLWNMAANGTPTVDEKFVALLNRKGNTIGIVLDGEGQTLVDEESITSALLSSYEDEEG